MYSIITKPAKPIVAGAYLIGVVVISWTGMHVVFFGVPRFANLSEIVYTSASLLLIGIGVYSIMVGIRANAE